MSWINERIRELDIDICGKQQKLAFNLLQEELLML